MTGVESLASRESSGRSGNSVGWVGFGVPLVFFALRPPRHELEIVEGERERREKAAVKDKRENVRYE